MLAASLIFSPFFIFIQRYTVWGKKEFLSHSIIGVFPLKNIIVACVILCVPGSSLTLIALRAQFESSFKSRQDRQKLTISRVYIILSFPQS